jgi:hypothetical protein
MVKMEHVTMLVIQIFRVTFRVIIDSKKDFWGVVSGLPNSFLFNIWVYHPGFSPSGLLVLHSGYHPGYYPDPPLPSFMTQWKKALKSNFSSLLFLISGFMKRGNSIKATKFSYKKGRNSIEATVLVGSCFNGMI